MRHLTWWLKSLTARCFCVVFGHQVSPEAALVRTKIRDLLPDAQVHLLNVSCLVCGAMVDLRNSDDLRRT